VAHHQLCSALSGRLPRTLTSMGKSLLVADVLQHCSPCCRSAALCTSRRHPVAVLAATPRSSCATNPLKEGPYRFRLYYCRHGRGRDGGGDCEDFESQMDILCKSCTGTWSMYFESSLIRRNLPSLSQNKAAARELAGISGHHEGRWQAYWTYRA